MARYRHYDPQQTKMIAVSYARQLLPGTFEHALSYLIDNEIDLGRFAERFKNDETGAPAMEACSGTHHRARRCLHHGLQPLLAAHVEERPQRRRGDCDRGAPGQHALGADQDCGNTDDTNE